MQQIVNYQNENAGKKLVLILVLITTLGAHYAQNYNELIVMVMICLYSSMMVHQTSVVIISITHIMVVHLSFKMRCLVSLQKILHTVRIIISVQIILR